MQKYGFKNNINPINDTTGNLSNPFSIFPARVKNIILSKEDPGFEKYGKYNSLGLIIWEPTSNPTKYTSTNNTALPLFPNIKNYPLEKEIVFILSLPGTDLQEDLGDITHFYFSPVNIWQSVHQNALPDNVFQPPNQSSNSKTNQEVEGGSFNKEPNTEKEEKLGKYFENRPIKDLQMFEGDVSLQGRWGNSLRFGSTIKNKLNDWSESGDNGDAITIIRNGQHENNEETWVPISENINEDKSSIYLTTSQKIPIEVASNSYNSYENAPTLPNEYVEDQVILNSGRLLFNSKSDSILLSSNQSINLNSINSVNIDTSTLSVKADKVTLGDKTDNEPILLGNKTVDLLSELLEAIISVANPLQIPYTVAGPTAANPGVQSNATNLVLIANTLKNQLETLKSKTSFTK
jgi:hypothetical protein